MNKPTRPIIGISVGDPAGIGPEVTLKALAQPEIYQVCRPLVIAETRLMQAAVAFSGANVRIRPISAPQAGVYEPGTIDLLDLHNIDGAAIPYRQVSAECGRAAFEYVQKVIELALAKQIDATVTGPINKEAINLAGFHYAGHTEIYAKLTQTKDYAMLLLHERFRVIHVSTHVALREACNRVKQERVYRVIQLAQTTLQRLGIAAPKIAVAGLNPHAGEQGLFGREEIEEIQPAVRRAAQEGINVAGPLPADTVFSKMAGGQYDVVVVMYHDQGHIPTKLLGFRYNEQTGAWDNVSGVNLTCGLPIIRVSVDHGTAFDKAGEGRANSESMVQAIQVAAQLATQKDRHS
jgi:4-phospho-D-threonate 3-dehydrogenase / 4-phospho-D-erythronate 3-dehydrogenase